MENKQTAVQWLFEQFFKVKWGAMQGNTPTIFEQALQMEREQIEEAFEYGEKFSEDYLDLDDWRIPCSSNYYTQTFKP
jgi:hypothetical protein